MMNGPLVKSTKENTVIHFTHPHISSDAGDQVIQSAFLALCNILAGKLHFGNYLLSFII